ncbi:MAG: hypothetical protein IJB10_03070 [Clostridia bacterium]|nr:hypothetical protein [Clostridia bacterium]
MLNMNKEELKNKLEEYWYDNKYLEEKTKEIESINHLIKIGKTSNLIITTKKHSEMEISKIVKKKKYIETLFQKLIQPYQILMYLRYISFLTFDEIADRMNYSTKRIYQLHTEALNKLLDVINIKSA